MILIILIAIWFATLAALALRIAIVRRERTGSSEAWERSAHLLDAGRDSLQQAAGEGVEATPVVSSSEPAATEHVRDGAQEDLYVGP